MNISVWLGYDPKEAISFAVARESINLNATSPILIRALELRDLQAKGLYYRPGKLGWDNISNAPMSTEFAISRFLTPILSKSDDWAIFMDSDILALRDLNEITSNLDPKYAVMCVKHNHVPSTFIKKGGLLQTSYPRKNWSSVMAFNIHHPANKNLTVELINSVPGRDLHRFCWLNDEEIGALSPCWNHLVGENEPISDPAIVHFTNGIPLLPEYINCAYSAEWFQYYSHWLHKWLK